MCKYSVSHPTVDPKQGQALQIGKAGAHNGSRQVTRAVFKTEGSSGTCACVKHGTKLTLTNVPSDLQKQHGVGAHAIATMIDNGRYAEDMLKLSTGKKVPLIEFANQGIVARVGVFDQPKDAADTVKDVIDSAIAGAKTDGSAVTPARELANV